MSDTIPTINPHHTALLVMDFQKAILNHLTNSDDIVARAVDAIRTARLHGIQVGYVWVAFAASDYAGIPAANKSFAQLAGRAGFMHVDAPETAVDDRVAPVPGDVVVRKTRVGAFSTTDLDAQLRGREINTLVLAGISTSGVMLSTVRDAADRDYRLFVLSDATADPDLEVHELLIRKVFPRQAYVIATADLPGLLKLE